MCCQHWSASWCDCSGLLQLFQHFIRVSESLHVDVDEVISEDDKCHQCQLNNDQQPPHIGQSSTAQPLHARIHARPDPPPRQHVNDAPHHLNSTFLLSFVTLQTDQHQTKHRFTHCWCVIIQTAFTVNTEKVLKFVLKIAICMQQPRFIYRQLLLSLIERVIK